MAKQDLGISPSKKLVEILTGRCRNFLLKLDSSTSNSISSRECFDFWSYLGELKHGLAMNSTVNQLVAELTRCYPSKKAKLVRCLEAGVGEALDRLRDQRDETERLFDRKGLGSDLTSYEFNDGLLGIRDKLGYVDLMKNETGVELSTDILRKFEAIDTSLRDLLPKAVQQFRENDDDPTPHPERFPETFWWRRLSANLG